MISGKLILNGRSDSIELVCGALGECLLDQNPHVRRAVYEVASSWLAELRDRYSYFYCILPLILTGFVYYLYRIRELIGNFENILMLFRLNDENCSYRKDVQNWWQKIGLQYLEENEEHLKDKHELLPAELEDYPFDGKP